MGGLTATFNKLLTETEKIAPENIDSIIDAISKQGGLIDEISPAQRAFEERLLRHAVKPEKKVNALEEQLLRKAAKSGKPLSDIDEQLLRNIVKSDKTVTDIIKETLDDFRDKLIRF